MEKRNLSLCESFYNSHYIPIAIFDDENDLKCFSSFKSFSKLAFQIKEQIKDITSFPTIVVNNFNIYGVIKIDDSSETIIVGPFINREIDSDCLDNIINSTEIDWNEKEDLRDFLNSIPQITYNQFLSLISFLNLMFNNEEIDVISQFELKKPSLGQNIDEKYTDIKFSEEEKKHSSYVFEKQMLACVSNGDVYGLSNLFNSVLKGINFTIGKVAETQLRQEKNIFIGLIAIVGKTSAIKGGMDIEQAYSLIDLYTQECERCQSIEQVYLLRYNALIDFTTKVAQCKHLNNYSVDVSKAYEYIRNHTTDNIGVIDVVDYVGCSRTQLLTKFKKETGQTVGKTIMLAKLEDSKNMLIYTDKTLSDISETLCFSSQSYFQNTFKKEYDITPLEFRNQNKKR